MNKFPIKKFLPYLTALVVFAVLIIVFFLPLFQGMVLSQGDISQFDAIVKETKDYRETHGGDEPLWNSRVFCGMPTVQISQVYKANWMTHFSEALSAVFPSVSAISFMLMLGFYILLLCLEVNPWLALAGTLAYAFGSNFMISLEAGHNTKVMTMAYMAPVLGGVLLAYRGRFWLGGATVAFFLSMAILSNHLQVTYYLMLLVGFVIVYQLIESILKKQLITFAKASAVLAIAACLAVMPNISSLWGTYDYGKETIRGGSSELSAKKSATNGGLDLDYATRWSQGLWDGEMLTLIIPGYKGGGSGEALGESSATATAFAANGVNGAQADQYLKRMPVYWGKQPFTSGPVYFGALVFFLFVLALLVVKSDVKWLLVFITVFSILLSAGKNAEWFYKPFFDHLPMFNKFRTPAMALIMAELAMPLLAMLGLNEILNGKLNKDDLIQKLKIALGISAGIVFVFGVVGSFMGTFSSPNDAEYYERKMGWMMDAIKLDRASIMRMDSLRSLFFILAGGGLLWAFIQNKVKQNVLIASLAVLFLVDSWGVSKRYLKDENFVEDSQYKNQFAPTAIDQEILRDTDPNYRVFNVTGDPFNDAMTSYYHKCVGGYHPAKLIRYQDLIENQISKNNMQVLNMLNTRYFIVKNPQTSEPMVQRNTGALGNCWFPKEIKWVKNADEEMKALNDFIPAQTVVIDERYKTLVGNNIMSVDSSGTIKETYPKGYDPKYMTYESSSNSNHLAVFSELFYDKGWKAFVDGKEQPIVRVNYTLRALTLPAGQHKIEFKFAPTAYYAGENISLIGSILLLLFVFGTLGYKGFEFYKNMEAEPIQEKKVSKPASAKKK